MRAHISGNRGNLLVGQEAAERRHALASIDDQGQYVAGGCELGIPGESRIGAGADCTHGSGHMTALANVGIESLAGLRHEAIWIAEAKIGGLRPRRCHCRTHNARRQREQQVKSRRCTHAVLLVLYYPASTRRCSRAMASRDERMAPSCQPPQYDACSPASRMRPSIAQRFW